MCVILSFIIKKYQHILSRLLVMFNFKMVFVHWEILNLAVKIIKKVAIVFEQYACKIGSFEVSSSYNFSEEL